jgi:hypothetical protein
MMSSTIAGKQTLGVVASPRSNKKKAEYYA